MAKELITDPRSVSLPPLAEGEVIRPDGDRIATVPLLGPLKPVGGFGHGLFGTMDIRGRGSHVEASAAPTVRRFL